MADPALNLVLVANPSSGGGRSRKVLAEAQRELGIRTIAHRVVETTSLEHGVAEALRAAEAGEVPVVISGDGMIGAIGGAMAGSNARMGVIPGGRGNDFARMVDIPVDVPEAVALLDSGSEREIDVGEANGRRFLCIASTGFDSVCNRRANETRFIRGGLVYAYSALRTLSTWKPARFTVTVDGEEHVVSGYSVAAANTKYYGGGMMIAPGAEPDDGRLEVVTIGEGGKLHYISNLPKVFKGAHIENEEVSVLEGAEVEISADRDFEVYADGEHLTDLPAKLRVLPRALRVIAPPAS